MIEIKHDLVQRSIEWKIAKLGLISASNSQAVFDGWRLTQYYADNRVNQKAGIVGHIKKHGSWTIGAETHAIQLAAERVVGELCIDEDEYVSADMQHGIDNEPIAREIYVRSRGGDVVEVGGIQNNNLWVSPDGLINDDGLIEIKCPQYKQHMRILLSDTLLDEYKHQVQFALSVSGRQWVDWMSFNPYFPDRLKAKVIFVERDEEYIANLEADLIRFEEYIQSMLNKVNG